MERHSLVLIIGFLVLGFLLWGAAAIPGENILKYVLIVLGMICVFVMPFVSAFGGHLLYSIRNASLRRNGIQAKAIILDARWIGETDSRGRDVSRFKLEVHPLDGPPFETIAEDSYYIWDFIDGQEINVWYDPATKDVALEKLQRTKEKNF